MEKENIVNAPHLIQKIKEMKNVAEQDECSPVMYDEFLNCNSYLYNMQDK